MQVDPFPRSGSGWSASWAARLIQRCDDLLAFLRGDFIPNGRLITRGGRNKGITLVTDATHAAAQDEELIDVNRAGTVTVTLLEDPDFGTSHRIYDSSGDASTNNITISRSGSGTINGGTSLTISTDFGGYELVYNSTQWIAHAI